MLEDVGPGTRGSASCAPATGSGSRARSGSGSRRHATAAARCSSAAASAPRRWRSGRTTLRSAGALRRCSASATPSTPRARRCCAARGSRPTTAPPATRARSPTCCSPSSGRDPHVEVYACGPPGMLEAVRAICAEHDVPAQLALESGMACGYGACFGCVVADQARLRPPVRRRAGARRRRPRRTSGTDASSTSTIRSSTRQARLTRSPLAVRSVTPCWASFPFAAFVTKTVTLAPRQGNPPPRLYELPAGLLNSIGLPNKGLERLPCRGPAEARRAARPADRQRDGRHARRGRAARASRRRARRGDGAGAQRLLPQRQNRSDVRRRSGRNRGAARRGAPAHDQAADRQAHAQLRLARRRRRGRRGARRRRRLADQHAARDGPASAPARRAVARRQAPAACPDPPSARSRSPRSPRSGRAFGSPSWDGWDTVAAVTPTTCCVRAQIWSPSAANPSGIRWPVRACEESSGPFGLDALAVPVDASRKPCKPRAYRQVRLHSVEPQLQVKVNYLSRPLSEAPSAVDSPPMPPATKTPAKPTTAAPERSLVQRMEALQRANEIRTKRATLKRDLKAGRASIHDLLLEPPEYVADRQGLRHAARRTRSTGA